MTQEVKTPETPELSKSEFQMVQVEVSLRKYLEKMNLECLQPSKESTKYLSMSQDVLQKLSSQECLEGAHLLHIESAYVQKERNVQAGKIAWANATLNWIITKKLGDYDRFLPFESKKILAVQENSYAQSLYTMITKLQRMLDSTNYLSQSLNNIASTLTELGKNKKGNI
jgi:hypothetical protein